MEVVAKYWYFLDRDVVSIYVTFLSLPFLQLLFGLSKKITELCESSYEFSLIEPLILHCPNLKLPAIHIQTDISSALKRLHTCNMSVLTFGTSLKNCNAATPKNIPNAPADKALYSIRL